jgi:hypothetical protein
MRRTFGDLIEDNNAIFAFLAPAAETCAPRCVLAATVGAACTSHFGAGRLKTAPYAHGSISCFTALAPQRRPDGVAASILLSCSARISLFFENFP